MVNAGGAPKPRDERSLDDVSIPELVSRALNEAKGLVGDEIELAKKDVQSEAKSAVRAAIGFGVAAAAVAVVLSLLSVALVLAVGGGPGVALALASGFAVLAGASGAAGYAWLPKEPLEPTRRRLVGDVDELTKRAI
jgi:Putative Actinobacterial Holin-X, holin superfamily III